MDPVQIIANIYVDQKKTYMYVSTNLKANVGSYFKL